MEDTGYTPASWSPKVAPIPEDEYPWISYLKSDDAIGWSELDKLEAIAWSRANGFRRPPLLGWPWWRIPLPGEVVPETEGVWGRDN